tara:strand:+ start:283 stop:705 length:423 start_codon:yes stop_codon:yes gene_type:complete
MTDKWGPTYWNYIHLITIYYPDKPTYREKKIYLNLVHNFIETLPCPTCKKEIKNLIDDYELKKNLENKELFSTYMFNIHNKVNKKLRKKIISYKRFEELYKFGYFSNLFKSIKYHKIKNIIIFVLIIIIVSLLYKIYYSK